jgi:DNA repair exonuclease SbcCD ATPase subunit
MEYFQTLFDGLEQEQSVQFLFLIFLTLVFGALLGALLQTAAINRWKNRYKAKEDERKALQHQLGTLQQQAEELDTASREMVRLQQQEIRQRALLQETQHQLSDVQQQHEIALTRNKNLELELEAANFKLDDLLAIKTTMVSREEYQRVLDQLESLSPANQEAASTAIEPAPGTAVPDYSYQLQLLEQRLAALESKTNTPQHG